MLLGLPLWAWLPGAWGFAWPKVVLLCAALVWLEPQVAPAAGVAFAAVLTLVSCWSRLPRASFFGIPGEWSACALAAWALVGFAGVKPGERWYRPVAVALAVHAIWQRFLPDLPWVHPPVGRASAWVGSPVDLGGLLAMGLPLAGWWWPVVLAGLIATGSRAAVLGGVLGGISQLLPAYRRGWCAVALAVGVLMAPRLLSAPKDQSRWGLWHAAAQDLREHPAGVGPGTFLFTVRSRLPGALDQTHPHNDLLEAASGGWLLIAAWLFLSAPLYLYPPLLALLAVMKFDPVSFEVLAIGALLAGNVLRQRPWRSSWAAGALAAAVLSQLYPLR